MRRVATETSGVDDGVGTILATLDRLGLADDTVVIYVADQGWVGGSERSLGDERPHPAPVGLRRHDAHPADRPPSRAACPRGRRRT